jgi:acetyl esterase/lipase
MKIFLSALFCASAFAQSFGITAANQYQMFPNVTYLTAGNVDVKLDVYMRRGMTTPQPTLVYMHGGFWVAGTKEGSLMAIMPWLEMGWNVVNVEYRLGKVALAPAAVEDCLCALRFISNQAKQYNIDVNKIVVTGESAGGHLALALGMIPESVGLDRECAGAPLPKVAAVIDWFGITDVADVIDGPHKANAAAQWTAGLPDRMEIAKRVSPMTYVRSGLPPIMIVHGDADTTVPYEHAVRLDAALTKANVPHKFYTVAGGKHGGFSNEERAKIYASIKEFLASNSLGAN